MNTENEELRIATMLATTFVMGVYLSLIAPMIHADKVTSHYQPVSCPIGDRADLSYPLSNTHTLLVGVLLLLFS